ncbi:outer mitochondrial transmembrane helix translocase-like [Panonychus citri]|uniref:outer mitochondrial transmembrane helix translocase-like n=1 Tax=Panonychus citri TaxID=50023 RepID=UPI0023078D50|nr:outer mitochondrial transmembrane helix translocase-like [Panonychus citri]
MDPNSSLKPELIALLIRSAVAGVITYYGIKLAVNLMDPTMSQKKKAKNKAIEILRNLGISDKSDDLNEHEFTIASDLLNPTEIDVTFNDIAGLDNIIEELNLQVILPLIHPEYFESNLRQPPRGVLFHGPPGCGKTMLAKAIAKQANVRFMNLSVSALTDKWYGESQKLAQAVFTLAMKIQPCIIFIDEIDSFLRSRDSHDHEATAMMKAQFMTLWEGILSSKKSQIVLIGATNRPQDVDKAVLRRMPCMFQIDLPKETERRQILELTLKHEDLHENVDLSEIAALTHGYSGSDLKDLCRRAAMKSLKELNRNLFSLSRDVTSENSSNSNSVECSPTQGSISSNAREILSQTPELRSITMEDFIHAVNSIDKSRTGIKPTLSKMPPLD